MSWEDVNICKILSVFIYFVVPTNKPKWGGGERYKYISVCFLSLKAIPRTVCWKFFNATADLEGVWTLQRARMFTCPSNGSGMLVNQNQTKQTACFVLHASSPVIPIASLWQTRPIERFCSFTKKKQNANTGCKVEMHRGKADSHTCFWVGN